jgi:hypothetical protein
MADIDASSSHTITEPEPPPSGSGQHREDAAVRSPISETSSEQHAQLLALVNDSCGCPTQPSANIFGIGSTVNHRHTCSHFAAAAIARVTLADRWNTYCERYGHPLDRPLDSADRRDPNILANYFVQMYSLIKALPNQHTATAMMTFMCFIEEVAWTAHSNQAKMDKLASLAILSLDVVQASLRGASEALHRHDGSETVTSPQPPRTHGSDAVMRSRSASMNTTETEADSNVQ